MGTGSLQDLVEILGELIKLFIRAVTQAKDAIVQFLERVQVLSILTSPVVEGLHGIGGIAVTVGCHDKDGGDPAGKIEKVPLGGCDDMMLFGFITTGYLSLKIGEIFDE